MQVHIRIDGQVQGVFFRAYAKEVADRLGIKGWIRNNSDGSVETIAEGSEENLREFVKWCKKGPPLAKVEDVEVDWQKTDGEFETFDVI